MNKEMNCTNSPSETSELLSFIEGLKKAIVINDELSQEVNRYASNLKQFPPRPSKPTQERPVGNGDFCDTAWLCLDRLNDNNDQLRQTADDMRQVIG